MRKKRRRFQRRSKTEAGFVYILINQHYKEDTLKIGMTTRNPQDRAWEMYDQASGVPGKFTVAFSRQVGNCELAEQLVHKHLGHYRLSEYREFFKISQEKAREIINRICDEVDSLLERITKIPVPADGNSKVAALPPGSNNVQLVAKGEVASCVGKPVDFSDENALGKIAERYLGACFDEATLLISCAKRIKDMALEEALEYLRKTLKTDGGKRGEIEESHSDILASSGKRLWVAQGRFGYALGIVVTEKMTIFGMVLAESAILPMVIFSGLAGGFRWECKREFERIENSKCTELGEVLLGRLKNGAGKTLQWHRDTQTLGKLLTQTIDRVCNTALDLKLKIDCLRNKTAVEIEAALSRFGSVTSKPCQQDLRSGKRLIVKVDTGPLFLAEIIVGSDGRFASAMLRIVVRPFEVRFQSLARKGDAGELLWHQAAQRGCPDEVDQLLVRRIVPEFEKWLGTTAEEAMIWPRRLKPTS